MIDSRLNLVMGFVALTWGTACQRGGSWAHDGSYVTLATPSLPTEVKDVKTWTYDLYCSPQNSGEATRTSAQLIASSTTAIDGAVTMTGDKVANVKAGWFCLMDMTTKEPVASVKDAKPALASDERKVFFSSAATQVPSDRKLKLELNRKYTTANSITGTGTGTGLEPKSGTSTNPGLGGATQGTSTAPKANQTTGSTPIPGGSGGSGGTPPAAQITLKIQGQGAAACPPGKRFNTDPRIMACQ